MNGQPRLLPELELELLEEFEFEFELLDEFELELPAYAVPGAATPTASATPTAPAPAATRVHLLVVYPMISYLRRSVIGPPSDGAMRQR